MSAEHSYPRPQLRRERWTSLNGIWNFILDPDLKYRSPQDIVQWPQQIRVPFAPECQLSGIADTGFHSVCWYERTFELEESAWSGGCRVILHFAAVDYHAKVWINGVLVAEHQGGYTPFSADITEALDPHGKQRLSVWVEDDPHDLEKPRGKQDWRLNPHSIWYPRTTGIWQEVWFEVVPRIYLRQVRWTPSVERWEIAFSAFTAGGATEDLRITVHLSCAGKLLASDSYAVVGNEVHRRIGLSDPGIDDYRNELLWSPTTPTLIDAEITLEAAGRAIDVVHSYTALRSIRVQREKILLNGRPYNLRLVLDQGYWPESFQTAPSDEHLRRDVELVKAMGFNGVRKHQKIEDPRYLYWADKLGLLVVAEMPSAYRFTTKSIRSLTREWTEVIERDASHPCIVMWVPFNESWGVPELSTLPAPRDAVAAFYHLTKTLDPSRLVIGNDGWESSATDVIGIHDYDCDPAHMRTRYGGDVKPQEVVDRRWSGGRILTLDGYPHRGQPICLSEFGGIALDDASRSSREGWGYAHAANEQDFEKMACALIEAVRNTAMFSGFCYTQFTDTFQEMNGLLYADRRPKIALEKIAAAVRGPAPHS